MTVPASIPLWCIYTGGKGVLYAIQLCKNYRWIVWHRLGISSHHRFEYTVSHVPCIELSTISISFHMTYTTSWLLASMALLEIYEFLCVCVCAFCKQNYSRTYKCVIETNLLQHITVLWLPSERWSVANSGTAVATS